MQGEEWKNLRQRDCQSLAEALVFSLICLHGAGESHSSAKYCRTKSNDRNRSWDEAAETQDASWQGRLVMPH